MTNSKRIAGLVGPTLIALSVSEALNLRLLTAEIGPNLVHVIYLNGTLLLSPASRSFVFITIGRAAGPFW
jgi:hypothetical protein